MIEPKRGMIVKSLAGHDKTQYFVILSVDSEYVYLADGKLRTVGKPKRKKRKHIQTSKMIDQRMEDSECVEDSYIRKLLKSIVAKHE